MDPHYAMCGDCWERELKRRETERDHALDDLKAEISNHREDEAKMKALETRVAELEACNTRLLCERDDADGWAGRLADAIAAHMREDIGEHSNLNNPWANALELIDGTFCR